MIQLNVLTKIIEVTTPTTGVTVQELVNAIRNWEDELENLSYTKVIDAVGKADLGGGVATGIVMTLSSLWQIQFYGGSGYTTVKGGTIVGGVGDEPVKATGTAGDITIQIQPTDATITTTNTDAIEVSINDIKKYEMNRWKIESNQLIIYDDDGTTPIRTFDLKDSAGSPTEENPYERDPV